MNNALAPMWRAFSPYALTPANWLPHFGRRSKASRGWADADIANVLTIDGARRIAHIAKLPGLLKAKG